MFKKQKVFILALMITIASSMTLFSVNAAGQQQNDVKALFLKEADMAMNAARMFQADVLAPKNFDKGMKNYREAEADLKQGKNLEDIQEKLRESSAYFRKAINATKLAEVSFPNSIKSRKDAQYTESAHFSPNIWKEAEEKFEEAAGKLEDGDLNDARKKAGEAEKLYRRAELESIKTNYLQGTRDLLKQADQADVKDRAPKTLRQAQQLVRQAEKELNENRYDTDVARSLAIQAKYQAKHAIYLARTIKQMDDKDKNWEDLMLVSETPLKRIAERMDRVASFDNGLDKTTREIIAYVATYQDSVSRLSQDLDWYAMRNSLQNARITELEQQLDARVAELEKKIGTQVREKSLLAMQIARQAERREIFARVERSFTREEASVLREGDDIIIRLVGLNFPSAAATIEQKSFGLLTIVRDAIKAFPGSTVSILGHTDSYGSDEQNLQLSKDRAEAVKTYLMANSSLTTLKIETTGYGESKPIAINETTAGRTANRRVEVVIHPKR